MLRLGLLILLPVLAVCSAGRISFTVAVPAISYVLGSRVTFATHAELAGYGFEWGPSDGQFGAIPMGGGNYKFYGTAGSNSGCAGTPNVSGAFTFSGTLDHVTGSNGCRRVFGLGGGPPGWVFDRDYAGGGQVVPFEGDGKKGWLMPFHGEFWWKNMANPPSYLCRIGQSASQVDCFYGGIGLAVSTDGGTTFHVVGQIMQPSQPLSVFQESGTYMDVGYGSLIVADANGRHLDNPPPNPNSAYFYLFFTDNLPGLPGSCAVNTCMGVARATYTDVIAAALSGDPHKVATVFHKYDGASPNPWRQPATSNRPDLSGAAGKFAPLWTDDAPPEVSVIYDRSFDVYLATYGWDVVKVRASNDLIHWSEPIGPPLSESGKILAYPTLIGETGDPTIAGPAPRIYFSSFPTNTFPDYTKSTFESMQLILVGESSTSASSVRSNTSESTSNLTATQPSPTLVFQEVSLIIAAVVLVFVGYILVSRRHPTSSRSHSYR
jgi:hypothetical protein